MKKIFILSFMTVAISLKAQILNGNFENNSMADLSNWEWTCGSISTPDAPPNGGAWCIEVMGGNLQACFPGYAFQRITSINPLKSYTLSCWAKATTNFPIGLYFGTINNGQITLQLGSTTTSNTWTELSVQSNFALASGDTAIVILHGGLVTGPLLVTGLFDLIRMEDVTGIQSISEQAQLTVIPQPFSSQALLQFGKTLLNAKIIMYDYLGQAIKQISSVSGNSYTLTRGNLAQGVYFIEVRENEKLIVKKKLLIADNY
ncbi:MAG: T9SS type A sorting domain-containing protein [Bacteroidetes bacterium]|nr:T9SS type A sorting domain-containing protein [Bacteroidota bacterium]